MWRRAGSATTLRPTSSRRLRASTALNPATVAPSFDRSSGALADQNASSGGGAPVGWSDIRTSRSIVACPSAGQPGLHHSAGLGHIHLPGIFAAQHADDLAHVFHPGGARLLHRRLDRRLHLVVRHLLRQVAGDDRDLLLLLLHEIGAAALLVKLDRFLALLDHFLKETEQLGIAERRLAGTARLDIGI